jgi:ABC-type glycerol-3-phosphate transport system substrate-binding protein
MKLNGTLTELSPFFKRDKLVPEKVFFPTTLEHWSDNGQQWGMPVSVSVDVLACNVGLFEQAGLALPPTDPADRTWTVDKFLEYAQKLTRGETQYGFFGVPSGYDVAGVSTGTWFGQLPWDDQKKKALMSQPDFVKGLQFFKDLRDKYRVAKPLPFREGSVAMQVHVSFRPPFPFKWAAVALPYGGSGRSLSGRQFPNGFQMGRAKETDASWSVLRWLTQPEVNSKMVLINTHVVSPLQDPRASEVTLQAFKSEIGIDGKAYFLQQQYCKTSGYGLLKYAPWGTLSTELNTRFNDFMGDKLSANDYAKEATTKIDQQIGTLK